MLRKSITLSIHPRTTLKTSAHDLAFGYGHPRAIVKILTGRNNERLNMTGFVEPHCTGHDLLSED